LAVTAAVPFSVNVQLFDLLFEHAPEKTASRPLPTVNVIDVPTVNDAVLLDPLITSRPVGVEVTWTLLRPVTVSVTAAVCDGGGGGGGGAGGFTVSVAVFVVPVDDAEVVTGVEVVTAKVDRLKTPVCEPAATVIVAGTLTAALLLDSETAWPPDGAAAVNVTTPCAPLPPVTADGDSCSDCIVTAPAAVVTVRLAVRVAPL
jgi:hypothetical protein